MVVLFSFLFSSNYVNAESDEYNRLYDLNRADQLKNALNNEAEDYIKQYDIDISKPDTLWGLNGFDFVYKLIKDSLNTEGSYINVLSALLVYSVVYAITTTFTDNIKTLFASFDAMSCAISALIIMLPISMLASETAETIKSVCVFMMAFIPVYTGAVVSTGAASSAASYSTLMYGVTHIYTLLANSVLMPLTSMLLTTSIGAAYGSIAKRYGQMLKNFVLAVMSFAGTLFLTVLSLQTSVSAPAESLGLKTIKTAAGTFIPVVGGVVSETVSAIVSAGSLLKSSIGTYSILCLLVMVVPMLIKLILWRIVAWISSELLELAGANSSVEIIRSVGSVITILSCLIIGVSASYILSVIFTLNVGR